MLGKVSKWLLILALCASIGAHWVFLQSVAWVGMAISYSQVSASFGEALAKTFDGKHPCKLCNLVLEGKKSEKKQGATIKVGKTDLFSAACSNFVFTPPMPTHCIKCYLVPFDHQEAPPTPPPRLTSLA